MNHSGKVIETKRLVLREWRAEDEAKLERYCNTPEVLRWLGGKLDERLQRELFRWLIEDQQKIHGHTFWALERKDDAKFLGFCGLVYVDEPDSTVLGSLEIGWRVRSDEQRKGYAHESASACIHYAFKQLKAYRVVSRTYAGNQPSWALMKKLGMWHDPRLSYVPADSEVVHGEPMIVHVLTYQDWKLTKARPVNTATWTRPFC